MEGRNNFFFQLGRNVSLKRTNTLFRESSSSIVVSCLILTKLQDKMGTRNLYARCMPTPLGREAWAPLALHPLQSQKVFFSFKQVEGFGQDTNSKRNTA